MLSYVLNLNVCANLHMEISFRTTKTLSHDTIANNIIVSIIDANGPHNSTRPGSLTLDAISNTGILGCNIWHMCNCVILASCNIIDQQYIY